MLHRRLKKKIIPGKERNPPPLAQDKFESVLNGTDMYEEIPAVELSQSFAPLFPPFLQKMVRTEFTLISVLNSQKKIKQFFVPTLRLRRNFVFWQGQMQKSLQEVTERGERDKQDRLHFYLKTVERAQQRSSDANALLPYERIQPMWELKSRYRDYLPDEFVARLHKPDPWKSTSMLECLTKHIKNFHNEKQNFAQNAQTTAVYANHGQRIG